MQRLATKEVTGFMVRQVGSGFHNKVSGEQFELTKSPTALPPSEVVAGRADKVQVNFVNVRM